MSRFTLLLDLHLRFVPPMSNHGKGIILTTKFELPFVPTNGLRVYSSSLDCCPQPGGFTLSDLIWDIDRQLFLAQTELTIQDHPMPLIVSEIKNWLGLGWRLGSYIEPYQIEADDEDMEELEESDAEEAVWVEALEACQKTWQQRTSQWNRVLKALIRHMVESYDEEACAYAFDKTGRFFAEEDIRRSKFDDERVRKFTAAKWAFQYLSPEEKQEWRNRTTQYPSINEAISSS